MGWVWEGQGGGPRVGRPGFWPVENISIRTRGQASGPACDLWGEQARGVSEERFPRRTLH